MLMVSRPPFTLPAVSMRRQVICDAVAVGSTVCITDWVQAKAELSVSASLVSDLTAGYTPVRIERLLNEALIVALSDGRMAMRYDDLIAAQLITEVGLAQEVGYHPDERRRAGEPR